MRGQACNCQYRLADGRLREAIDADRAACMRAVGCKSLHVAGAIDWMKVMPWRRRTQARGHSNARVMRDVAHRPLYGTNSTCPRACSHSDKGAASKCVKRQRGMLSMRGTIRRFAHLRLRLTPYHIVDAREDDEALNYACPSVTFSRHDCRSDSNCPFPTRCQEPAPIPQQSRVLCALHSQPGLFCLSSAGAVSSWR